MHEGKCLPPSNFLTGVCLPKAAENASPLKSYMIIGRRHEAALACAVSHSVIFHLEAERAVQ
jgi:hypothetical protein